MHTDLIIKEPGLVYGDLSHSIIGSAMEVLNTLGHGFPEKVYENALVQEFSIKQILIAQQQPLNINYKDTVVGIFIPDLIVQNSIIVDAKCIEKITDRELGQMINYLRITNMKIGLIINFKRAKLEWERVIL